MSYEVTDSGDDGGRTQPAPDAVREQLARILASTEFVASDRLKGFLRFVVEEALAGHANALKAYTIAVEVFSRDPGFDSQNDPVVRMEAGKLRRRLERYYLGAGRDDPIRIDIPKGTYAPTFDLRADGETTEDAPAVLASLFQHRPARSGLWGFGVLALAALVVLAAIWLRSQSSSVPPEAGVAPQARGPAVIVLPFENLSESDAGDWFAAGLTEELISNLMRFGELRLYSAYDSFLEQPSADPVELSERLDVGYVIKGSVRREPERIRVIAHLIEAQTGKHLWTETYDRPLTPENVISGQERLAADLASQLAQPYGIINQVTEDTFRRWRPDTLFAYDCVLRALDYRRTQGREKHAAARACLEEAVRRDPGYVDAWIFLAYTYLDEFRYGYAPRPYDPAALAQAASTARHAVELDSDSVPALLASSTTLFYQREFAEADEINRRLLTLNPANPDVLFQIGWRTAVARDWNEGIALIRRAIDRSIKPTWAYHLFIALDHYRRGDYRAALAAAESAPQEIVSASAILAAIHGQLGHRDAAQQALDRAKALNPIFMADPRAAWRRSNIPDELIDQLLEGLAKAGLRISSPDRALARRAAAP